MKCLSAHWQKKNKRKRTRKSGDLRLRGGGYEEAECRLSSDGQIPVFMEGSPVEVAETRPSSTPAWYWFMVLFEDGHRRWIVLCDEMPE